MAVNNISFLVVWMSFARTVGPIGGWQAIDILAMQGLAAFAFGTSTTFFFGLQELPEKVASGAFDRFLLSPKNLLLRVATSSLHVSALGDILFGVICLAFYVFLAGLSLSSMLLLCMFALSSSVLFFSLFLFSSSLSFYFTDASQLSRGLFELILLPAITHGGAFRGGLRFAFTFIIPSLALAALPVEVIKSFGFGRAALVFFLSAIWLFLSILFFYRSVQRYESANFVGSA
jgi:ABC-2 type transport system permease protein